LEEKYNGILKRKTHDPIKEKDLARIKMMCEKDINVLFL